MQAVILSIGDELALGQTVDTNSAYLSARLAELGIQTTYHQTLADDLGLIAESIRRASASAPLVLVTGGLGPTKDDLTRQALAQAMGVELYEDAASLDAIQAFFAERRIKMSETNRVQAQLPAGSQMIENANGTAPGIQATLNDARIFVMPGVPSEMRAMYQARVFPAIQGKAGTSRVILTTKVNTFGQGESHVGQLLGGLMDRDRNPRVGTTVTGGIVSVRIRSESDSVQGAQDLLDDSAGQVKAMLGSIVFGRDDKTLPMAAVDALRQAGVMVATAESCTGGLIGKLITDVAGSSEVYAGGWVTYTNQMKHQRLGVPSEVLEQHGAVSGQTVIAMAKGALAKSEADLAVSVSGVAGPGGGTPEKPVGTVWLGLADRTGGDDTAAHAVRLHLPGDREAVRNRSALCTLQWIRLHLADLPPSEMSWAVETFPNC
jgi:competence/damage-inducible protein CinA-like protein